MSETLEPQRRPDRPGRQRSSDRVLSHALSKTLRHAANAQGIPIAPDGYCLVSDLLQHQVYKSKGVDLEAIKRVVAENNKKRFELSADQSKIRAVQGHTMNVAVDNMAKLTQDTLPASVIHGTTLENWNSILASGLSRRQRLHIHLAGGLPGEVLSGIRANAQVLIYIDAKEAMQDGCEFMMATNNAILSPGFNGVIPPKYFLKAVRVKDHTEIWRRPS